MRENCEKGVSQSASEDAKNPINSRVFEGRHKQTKEVFKSAFVELCLGFELIGSKQPPPVMVTGGLDKLEKLWYNHAPNIMARLSHYSIARKLNIHTTLKIV